jgi:hypothetical protein
VIDESEPWDDGQDWLVDRLWDGPAQTGPGAWLETRNADGGARGEQRDTMRTNTPNKGDIEE